MKKVFYFGYGHDNFGYEKYLGEKLEIDFKNLEGAGIAIIKEKHHDEFKPAVKLLITNHSKEKIIIRVEKKFADDVKAEVQFLNPDSTKSVKVKLDNNELQSIKEIVVAVLKEDNIEIDNTSISLNIEDK